MPFDVPRLLACLILGSFVAVAPALGATPADTLVVGDIAAPATLDPQAATSPAEFRILSAIFEGLVRFKAGSMDVEPALAERWTVSPDGLTYSFDLKAGIRFQDGTPLDSAAVVATFERLLDPALADAGTFPLAFIFAPIESVRAVDEDTVAFKLRLPYAPILASLATPTGFILSPSAIKTQGAALSRHPVGTGPYRLGTWKTGSAVELERSAAYRGEAAGLAKAEFQAIPDPVERLAALKAGRIDAMTEPAHDALPALRKGRTGGPILAETTAPHLWFLILNTKEGVFSDRRVRQAANYAIDRQAIAEETLGGGARLASGPIPSAFGASAGDVAPYAHDPGKARALIREAGAEGKSVTFLVAQGGSGMLEPVTMAQRIAADLSAAGLDAKIQTYEWNTFLSNVNPGLAGKADMAEMAWTVFDPDTLPFLALRSTAKPGIGGFNAGGYANPEVDRRLEEARRTGDPATRARLYAEIQRIVHEDAPFAFVVESRIGMVVAPDVEGLSIEPTGLIDLAGATKP
ncbi:MULTISPECIES: ABC transporter substrate-binding protein [unclassified Aureimonas]|uniref:ABC transporter substrate-binding protein n=1 Tax=unclassified Aureimonas TaxID=2615206 RepID=UPI0006FB0516|nr:MULTISPECIES: ABC transporter substrate-binding protein [unclassified Aureimonas]KQT66212.1 hypothetical protein ASG62_19440 [Aureimonas sp. Leaf427]KQT72400.1 hypothetical protein ASG54_03810 [Aureimonas sp. Leaf460]